jgi:hypothetical protein
MVTVGAVRVTALVICAGGIIGMIVTSILNHNGAAVTFGLITAVAIVCSMVAKAVATSTEQRLLGQAGGLAAVPGEATKAADGAPATATAGAPAEPLAEEVERRVQAIVSGGADEAAVRQLVGEAVRLGRVLAGGPPTPRASRR